MSKQCLDISQMQHLKELGVDTSITSARVYKVSETENYCGYSRNIGVFDGYIDNYIDKYDTFTLQDILDLLPKSTKYGQLQIRFCEYPNGNYGNEVVYDSMAHNGITFFCENVIDSAYEMLCLCIKEGFVKTNKED